MQNDEPLQESYCEDDLAGGPDEYAVKQRQPNACSGQGGGKQEIECAFRITWFEIG